MSLLSLGFVNNAEAIIGMPWTPRSYAGVARRSMYAEAAYGAAAANAAAMNAAAANAAYANAAAARAAAAILRRRTSRRGERCRERCRRPAAASALPVGTIVPNLPPGCTSTALDGVDYFHCAGVYYRAGFQGNNVVYIVSAP